MLAAGRGCWCWCGGVQLHMVHQLEAAGLIGAAAGALLNHAVVHTEAAALQIPHVAAHGRERGVGLLGPGLGPGLQQRVQLAACLCRRVGNSA